VFIYQRTLKKTRKKRRLAVSWRSMNFNFLVAILIAWPALAYLGAKMFNLMA
jgi:hypothetical protein